MTGKELNSLKNYTSPTSEGTITLEKSIIFNCTSSLGDHIEVTLTSPNRAKYLQIAEIAWLTLITDYTLLPNNLIYLPPTIYWNLYKRIKYGKEFLKGVGQLLKINGVPHKFVDADYYFNISFGTNRGVYGIYYKNILLYIGSASDLTQRWREHDAEFREKSSKQKLYNSGYDPDEIEYRILISQEDLDNLIPATQTSMWLFEVIEWSYIKLLQPLYNIEGKTKSFSFQARQTDLPVSYWDLVKLYLTSDSIAPESILSEHIDDE